MRAGMVPAHTAGQSAPREAEPFSQGTREARRSSSECQQARGRRPPPCPALLGPAGSRELDLEPAWYRATRGHLLTVFTPCHPPTPTLTPPPRARPTVLG